MLRIPSVILIKSDLNYFIHFRQLILSDKLFHTLQLLFSTLNTFLHFLLCKLIVMFMLFCFLTSPTLYLFHPLSLLREFFILSSSCKEHCNFFSYPLLRTFKIPHLHDCIHLCYFLVWNEIMSHSVVQICA